MGSGPLRSLLRDVLHMVPGNGRATARPAAVREPAWGFTLLRHPDHGLERDCPGCVVTPDGVPYRPHWAQTARLARELYPRYDLPVPVFRPELLAVLRPGVHRRDRRGNVVDKLFRGDGRH